MHSIQLERVRRLRDGPAKELAGGVPMWRLARFAKIWAVVNIGIDYVGIIATVSKLGQAVQPSCVIANGTEKRAIHKDSFDDH